MSNKNKDQDSEWKLYTKAYELASRTGQIKTGTYGDPERSGILDNHYHLISTQGKLLDYELTSRATLIQSHFLPG